MTALLVILVVALAVAGAPLFLVLAAGALIGSMATAQPDVDILASVMTNMYRLSQESVIVALPLFTFAGYLLAESKAPMRMVRLSRALIGWMPGGLALVSLVTCSIFTAFSGASGVTVIALGGLLLPVLLEEGYKERFSLGLLTTSGVMGLLLPPSLALILFGIVAGNNLRGAATAEETPNEDYYTILYLDPGAPIDKIEKAYKELKTEYQEYIDDGEEDAEEDLAEVEEAYAALKKLGAKEKSSGLSEDELKQLSIDNLFKAGLLPSLFMLILLSSFSVFRGQTRDVERPGFSKVECWKAFRAAIWEAPLPVIILGGIYGGLFTVLDAAAVTAFYVLIVEVFIYRDIHLRRDLPRVTVDSLVLIGSILLILMCAMGFTGYLIDQEVPAKVIAWIQKFVDSRIGFLLMLNVCLLVVGFLMDIFSATVVVVPLILPLAIKFGVHPVHLGIVFLTNLQIGFLTPPVGLELFLASSRFEKPVLEIFRATLPFLVLLIVALLVITYVPWLSLALI
jgi:TRAP-type C4-dicarboxylate transport system permease large subunit